LSAADLATVLVTVAAFASLMVLVVAVGSLLRTMRALRMTLDRLHAETLPAVVALRDTAAEAGLEVERIDELLTTAESISATVEGASRLGYLAFRRPFIRTVAILRGIASGLWRLVGGGRHNRRGEPAAPRRPTPPAPPTTDLHDRRRARKRAA